MEGNGNEKVAEGGTEREGEGTAPPKTEVWLPH